MNSHYYKARTLMVSTAGIACLSFLFGSVEKLKLPVVEIEVTGESSIALSMLLLIAFFSAWTILEWMKLDKSIRKLTTSMVDLFFSLALSGCGLALMTYELTPDNAIWSVSPFAAVVILIIGELMGLLLSATLFSLQFIRSASEAKRKGLPRIPFATKAQMPLLVVILITTAAFITWMQFDEQQESRRILYGIYLMPIILHAIAGILELVRMDKNQRAELQAVFDGHDAGYIVADFQGISTLEFQEITKPSTEEELELLRLQLRNGMNPNEIGQHGWTPLMMAAANGDTEAFELLVEYGGDVNSLNDLGRSALNYACNYGNEPMVDKLLSLGANPNPGNGYGGTPLMVAAAGGFDGIVEKLISYKADIAAIDVEGKTALDLAEANNQGEAARIIRTAALDSKDQISD